MHKLQRSHFIFLAGFFLFIFGILLLTGSGRPKTTDEYMVFFQAESFWTQGHFSVPQAPLVFHHWYGKQGLDGLPYAPYGLLHALFLSPLAGLGKIFFVLTGLARDKWILAGPFMASLFSSLSIVLSACLLGCLALKEGILPKYVIGLMLSFLFATPLAAYGGTLFSEPLTLLIWTGVITGLASLRQAESGSEKTLLLLGLSAALTGWVRPNQWVYLPVIFIAAIYFLANKNLKNVLLFCVTAIVVVGALLFYNQITYGHCLDFGYPDFAESGKKLNEFKMPFWKGLFVLVAGPGKSFLLYAPVSLLALAQIGRWKENLFARVWAFMLFVYLFFFSRFSSVEGGYCFGPRFFINLIPFAYVSLLPLLKQTSKKFIAWFVGLTLFGVLVNFPGLFTSFLEEQVDHHYYGTGFVYQIFHADSWEQWKMLFNCIETLIRTGSGSMVLGTGWDLGAVFLAKAGVDSFVWKGIVAAGLSSMVLGLFLVFLGLRGIPENTSQKEIFQ